MQYVELSCLYEKRACVQIEVHVSGLSMIRFEHLLRLDFRGVLICRNPDVSGL